MLNIRQWFECKTRAGKSEQMRISIPLRGPYIRVRQDSEIPENWSELSEAMTPQPMFDMSWGEMVFQRGPNDTCEKVAEWIDTSG